ncbi:MAG: hypothetical protein JNM84_02355, partial [Planctomycetes bacterium]|nr:hypothetical protein [Planctomycetota bacterium]
MSCPSAFRSALASLAIAAGALASAAGQELVRDFNTTPSSEAGSSHPRSFVALPGGDLLLGLSTPRFGDELWRTDGTAAGTRLVADLQPGPGGSQFLQMTELSPGVFLFTARTVNEGWELWRTDGTSGGTQLLADVWPGPESSVAANLVRAGQRIFFFANDGAHGLELWSSDGTRAGTQMVLDLVPGSVGMSNGTAQIAALGSGAVLFSALVNGVWELWTSDGTAAGTTRSAVIPGLLPSSGPSKLTSLGS